MTTLLTSRPALPRPTLLRRTPRDRRGALVRSGFPVHCQFFCPHACLTTQTGRAAPSKSTTPVDEQRPFRAPLNEDEDDAESSGGFSPGIRPDDFSALSFTSTHCGLPDVCFWSERAGGWPALKAFLTCELCFLRLLSSARMESKGTLSTCTRHCCLCAMTHPMPPMPVQWDDPVLG